MLLFIKYLIQLVLSPSHGWEDIEHDNPSPERLMHRGLVPLAGIAAASEFFALFWERGLSAATVAVRAIVDFGTYFVAAYIAKLIFDMYIYRVTDGEPDNRRSFTLAVIAVGMMAAIRILDNLLPWNLVLMRFLPLYIVLVIYKAAPYMHVRRNREMNFMILASAATVAVPLAIYYLFFFILP
ncbi:MAG: hypothetical protein K2L16_02740 [Muribaculaceae bacterium]|nr:hypothetical protein [Muribaculaceae bacterium]